MGRKSIVSLFRYVAWIGGLASAGEVQINLNRRERIVLIGSGEYIALRISDPGEPAKIGPATLRTPQIG